MKFLIIAVDHGTQTVPLQNEIGESIEKKTRLRQLVTEAIANRDVDLICEESDPCRPSIAQEHAYKNAPRVPWKNINMTAQERLEAGIWEALLYRPFDHKFLDENHAVTIEHRVPEDDVREEFFRNQILEAVKAHGATSVLILCGDMHVEFLKTKLEATGLTVETNHDLIAEKHWQ